MLVVMVVDVEVEESKSMNLMKIAGASSGWQSMSIYDTADVSLASTQHSTAHKEKRLAVEQRFFLWCFRFHHVTVHLLAGVGWVAGKSLVSLTSIPSTCLPRVVSFLPRVIIIILALRRRSSSSSSVVNSEQSSIAMPVLLQLCRPYISSIDAHY